MFPSSSKSFKAQLLWQQHQFATFVKLCKPENFNCHLDAIYRRAKEKCLMRVLATLFIRTMAIGSGDQSETKLQIQLKTRRQNKSISQKEFWLAVEAETKVCERKTFYCAPKNLHCTFRIRHVVPRRRRTTRGTGRVGERVSQLLPRPK